MLFIQDTAGVSGYFNMNIENGTALYKFSIDMSKFDPGTCDISDGLTYHIHSYWTNTSTTSGANGYCGVPYTGNHFDPNLACGPSSQNAGSLCVDIGRTSTSTPTYSYACNTANYGSGHYAFCEVGDLSGKFGRPVPTASVTLEQTADLVDYMPAYIANYKTADAMTYPWQSVVFHCNQGGARLFCAEFIQGSSCDMSTDSTRENDDDKDEWGVGGWNSLAKLLVSLGVVLAVGLAVAGYFIMKKGGNDSMGLLGQDSSSA
jgi:hypothetical protein